MLAASTDSASVSPKKRNAGFNVDAAGDRVRLVLLLPPPFMRFCVAVDDAHLLTSAVRSETVDFLRGKRSSDMNQPGFCTGVDVDDAADV